MTAFFDPQSLIAAMAGARVLCLGDLMLDRFVYGAVERISPEAPIPVLRVDRETLMPGAAGNVAANLVALGVDVRFVSVVGDDDGGRRLASLLGDGLGCDPALVIDPSRETTLKTRYIASGQQLLRADRETGVQVHDDVGGRVADAAVAMMEGCGAVVLSDYAKGVLTPAVLARVLAAAAEAGLPVIVDPKGRDFRRYRGAGVLTPNRRELAEASGLPTRTDAEVAAAAKAQMAEAGIAAIVVTRSEQGLSVVLAGEGDHGTVHFRAEAREVFDVSGAGDTVVATLASALAGSSGMLDGRRLAAAARLANLAGGIVVGKAGTAVVHADELMAALHHQDWARGEAKVAGRGAARDRVAQWRAAGLTVGFTNGCFDLLHPGHISLIRQAREACDRLVVAINSDASVRRLKGESRPVQAESARAAVLASLEAVDLVTVFGEDTPLELIGLLRPDVLVKGADYQVETVVGADLVHGYGGRVMLAALEAGFSTTATIARLQR